MSMKKEDLDLRRSYERALLLGCGYSYEDLEKPRIALASSLSALKKSGCRIAL